MQKLFTGINLSYQTKTNLVFSISLNLWPSALWTHHLSSSSLFEKLFVFTMFKNVLKLSSSQPGRCLVSCDAYTTYFNVFLMSLPPLHQLPHIIFCRNHRKQFLFLFELKTECKLKSCYNV